MFITHRGPARQGGDSCGGLTWLGVPELFGELPREERARLAETLISSLDEEGEVERAWNEEIRRRLQELDAGSVETVSAEEVLAELDELVE